MKPSELLDKPEKWTRGVYAKTMSGNYVEPESGNASRWCIKGAALACGIGFRDKRNDALYLALKEAVAKLFPARFLPNGPSCTVAAFNDHPETTFEDVRRVLIEAGL